MTRYQRVVRASALLCNVRDELKASASPLEQAAARRLDLAEEEIRSACALLHPGGSVEVCWAGPVIEPDDLMEGRAG